MCDPQPASGVPASHVLDAQLPAPSAVLTNQRAARNLRRRQRTLVYVDYSSVAQGAAWAAVADLGRADWRLGAPATLWWGGALQDPRRGEMEAAERACAWIQGLGIHEFTLRTDDLGVSRYFHAPGVLVERIGRSEVHQVRAHHFSRQVRCALFDHAPVVRVATEGPGQLRFLALERVAAKRRDRLQLRYRLQGASEQALHLDCAVTARPGEVERTCIEGLVQALGRPLWAGEQRVLYRICVEVGREGHAQRGLRDLDDQDRTVVVSRGVSFGAMRLPQECTALSRDQQQLISALQLEPSGRRGAPGVPCADLARRLKLRAADVESVGRDLQNLKLAEFFLGQRGWRLRLI